MIRAGDKIGPYTLVRRLGRGTFGVVWLAEKRTTLAATKVALKLPNDDDIDLEAVKREAAVWVEASGHPNVLPIIDADIYDEQVVIVSEFAPDGSLADWLKEHGGKAPTLEAAVEITLGILDGLAHLHARR
ncbi:MAG: serine/threonine protein kinase, partial [Acidobacteria bacterium]